MIYLTWVIEMEDLLKLLDRVYNSISLEATLHSLSNVLWKHLSEVISIFNIICYISTWQRLHRTSPATRLIHLHISVLHYIVTSWEFLQPHQVYTAPRILTLSKKRWKRKVTANVYGVLLSCGRLEIWKKTSAFMKLLTGAFNNLQSIIFAYRKRYTQKLKIVDYWMLMLIVSWKLKFLEHEHCNKIAGIVGIVS